MSKAQRFWQRPWLKQSAQRSKYQTREGYCMAKPIPDGFHSVTPYLIISGAAQAIDFYKKAFGATELFRMPGPDGRIMHAEIKIGTSIVMISEACPEWGSPAGAAMNHIYVEN